uniref:Protein FAM221A n=1 Tax=Lepisosteus oculatus TaxID=7918 RepID=W5N0Y5_LEPOC|nr:PREDICTED: protein FAM221A isoform X1 [Lepisosteus oculatus]
MEKISVSGDASLAVEEYLEYRRIVGDDDGGQTFTPEEYEEYKRRVLPSRLRNRLYVSWGVPGGIDCKLIGPETPCFCTHRYKQHRTDFERLPGLRRPLLPCRARGCGCESYRYVPRRGSQPARCSCKHAAEEHSEAPGLACRRCASCSGFRCPSTCGCGQPGYAHETLVETEEQRRARGRPVGRPVPYAAMGGLTGFSSLAEGYLRLDASGAGVPPSLAVPPSGSAAGHTLVEAFGAQTPVGELNSGARPVPGLRSPEEDDMAYFERRYQERLKMEKMANRRTAPASGAKLPNRTPRQAPK